jgi:prepilin-type N-terminal cleavage/methylation domain-containing protein
MRHSYGFTFIELSVVLAILGILGLIAIPQYSSYRERMYSNAALGDLKNVAAAQEAYFVDNQAYKAITECAQVDTSTKCQVAGLPGVTQLSKGIALSVTTSPSGFIATARHYRANKTCTWDSTKGGLIGCS